MKYLFKIVQNSKLFRVNGFWAFSEIRKGLSQVVVLYVCVFAKPVLTNGNTSEGKLLPHLYVVAYVINVVCGSYFDV